MTERCAIDLLRSCIGLQSVKLFSRLKLDAFFTIILSRQMIDKHFVLLIHERGWQVSAGTLLAGEFEIAPPASLASAIQPGHHMTRLLTGFSPPLFGDEDNAVHQ